MILLNGQPFALRSNDTKETVIARIALQMKTHPSLLIFPDPLEMKLLESQDNVSITALDFYQVILKGVNEGKFDFYSNLPEHYRSQLPYSREDIFREWLRILIERHKIDADFESILSILYADILGNLEIDQFIREGTPFNKLISNFLEEQALFEAKFDDFTNLKSVITTRFTITKTTIEVAFQTDYDLTELFDQCKVSLFIPYLNINNFHKAHQTLKNIPEEWTGSLPEIVRFFIRHSEDGYDFEKHYSEGLMTVENGEYKISLETPIEARLNPETLLRKIFECFNLGSPDMKKVAQKSINAMFYIPHQRFSPVLFRDVIMNNPLLSSMCYSDESARLGRFRTGLSFFYHPVNLPQKIMISMIEGIADAKDFQKDQLNFPVNSVYVKMRLHHAPNQAIAEDLMRFLGRLFTIYNQEEPKLISYYQTYLNVDQFDFKKDVDIVKVGGNRLQDLLPSIFRSGYPRSCQHPPIINKDIPPEPYQGNYIVRHPVYREAILFPKTKEEGPQNWFVCEEGYPGLKKNNLDNASEFPYLPCCYKNSQIGKKNMISYYQNISKEDEKTFTHILKTPKFLSENELGYLPTDIFNFFRLVIPIEILYFRKGTPRGKDVFFRAVAKALNKKYDPSMITEKLLLFDRQSNYTQTFTELLQEVKNGVYLEPRKYLRTAEELFDCSIFLFSRSKENEVKMVLPYYEHFYASFPKEKQSVVILEHFGTESDAAEYPQCELIVAGDKNQQHLFYPKEITVLLDQAQNKILSFHLIDNPYKMPTREQNLPSGIKFQFIDDFGKTRGIQIEYQGSRLNILTGPLPILHVPQLKSYTNNDADLAQKYIQEHKWTILKEENGYIFTQSPEGYIYQFPIKIGQVSNYLSTQQAKRIARLLSEYSLYLFSKFCFEQKLECNPQNLERFFTEKTIVLQEVNGVSYQYPRTYRRFEKVPWLKDGKLILNSSKLIPGLKYNLRLNMLRNLSTVINYHHQIFFKNFFLEKSDFTATQTESGAILFSNAEDILFWSDSEASKIKIVNFPRYKGESYLLETSEGKFLCQPAYSYDNAVDIYRQWKNTNEPIVMMAFLDNNTLQLLSPGKPNILVWREEGALYYNAILS